MASEKNKKEDFDDEEMTMEDLVYEAHLKIDALIDILIEKKVLTEEELNDKMDEFIEEDMNEDSE